MSQESDETVERADQQQPSRGWRIVKRVGIGALLLIVAYFAVAIVLDTPHKNELGLRGGLKIEVESGVDVYVGNKHVGTGLVELRWDDLLGTAERQPLATPISSDAPLPRMEGMGGVTAEALADEGSQIVWSRQGMTAGAQNLEPIWCAWKQVLLRRQNGDLDLILVLDGEFRARTGKWRRFLIPIRLRSANEELAEYFSDSPSGGISSGGALIVPGTRIRSELWLRLRSKHEPPPNEFADEIAKRGLWKPSK